MESIQALRERRATVAASLKKLMDDTAGVRWEPQHQEKYDAGMREVDEIDARVTSVQKVLDLQAEERIERMGRDDRRDLERPDNISAKAIFNTFLRKGEAGFSDAQRAQIRNTMSTTTNSEGGYTVQTEVANTVLDALKAYDGAIRRQTDDLSTLLVGPQDAIVHGLADRNTLVADARALHRCWPGSSLVEVPGAGHSPFEPGMAAALRCAVDACLDGRGG